MFQVLKLHRAFTLLTEQVSQLFSIFFQSVPGNIRLIKKKENFPPEETPSISGPRNKAPKVTFSTKIKPSSPVVKHLKEQKQNKYMTWHNKAIDEIIGFEIRAIDK